MNLLQKIKSKNIKERFELVNALSILLKQEISVSDIPEWFNYTKTGCNVERLPLDPDWYYVRMASIVILLIHNPRSTQKLRNRYGSMKNRGSKPDRWFKAGGSIIRHMLQILEKYEFLSIHKKGRYTNDKGKNLVINLL